MELLSAFRELQPVTPGLHPEVRARVRDAARVLFSELHRLAEREFRGRGLNDADRDGVVQTILYRLLQAGPRGVRENDPQSSDAVTGWLTQAVRNAARDVFRKRKRLVHPRGFGEEGHEQDWFAQQPADESVDDGAIIDRLERARAGHAVARARSRLWSVLVPRAVARKERRSPGAGARLHGSLEELRKAVAAGSDVNELARQSLIAEGVDADRKTLGKRRAALDKRFQRAREAVLAMIDEERDRGDIDELIAKALVFVVQEELYMQRRGDSLAAKHRRTSPAAHRTASGGWPVG